MAIQTIYTSVDNAKIEQCKKGKPVPPMQIPLIRNNYLGEYRTQVEKDKVLKNLGILGVSGKYSYPAETEVDSYKDIQTVQQALDYCIKLIQSYEQSDKDIKILLADVANIQTTISELTNSIEQNTTDITTINSSIESINQSIQSLNTSISEFDQKLKDLNVDDKITNRINHHLEGSKTIELVNDVFEVKKSQEEENRIEVKEDGLYVPTSTYATNTTGTSPYNVGGIKEGTTAESLNGKSISDILDMILFPAYVRDLIYPTLTYSSLANLVEVNAPIVKPTYTFTQNDAGELTNVTETITLNGSKHLSDTYNSIGTYVFNVVANYSEGPYLTNNKGETTTTRVEAGSLSTSVQTVATYPWYAGNTNQVTKQNLVAFNTNSEVQEVSLSGEAVIKLPGEHTQLLTFKVNGGLGFLNVDLDGWSQSTEKINGIIYKVWTKNESYSAVLPHQLTFKLAQ